MKDHTQVLLITEIKVHNNVNIILHKEKGTSSGILVLAETTNTKYSTHDSSRMLCKSH
jgi:hypothetical protein